MRTRVHFNEATDYEDTPGAHTDFDFAEVARNLGEEIKSDIGAERFAELAVGLRPLPGKFSPSSRRKQPRAKSPLSNALPLSPQFRTLSTVV
jgi:hypothetical protein